MRSSSLGLTSHEILSQTTGAEPLKALAHRQPPKGSPSVTDTTPQDEGREAPSSARVLIPLGLGVAVSLLGDSTLYAVLPHPDIAAQVGVSLSSVGVLLGVNRLVRLLFNPLAGALFDGFPRRGLLIGSMVLGIGSTALYAVGYGMPPYLLGRVLWGAAWSGLWIGGNTVVLDIAGAQNRGRLSGQFQMWFFIGVGSAALLGGTFTDAFGYRQGLWLSAGLMVLMAVTWLIALPETRPATSQLGNRSRMSLTGPFPWRTSLSAAVPIFAVRFVLAGVMASTTILWLSSFFGERLEFAGSALPIATLTGAFVALRTLTGIAGAPLAGLISDRGGYRWPVVAGSLALGAGGSWLMSTTWIPLAVLGALMVALASGGVQALAPAMAGDRVAVRGYSRSLGLIYSLGDLGSALGPPIALALLGTLSIGQIYRLSAVVMAAALAFALRQGLKDRSWKFRSSQPAEGR